MRTGSLLCRDAAERARVVDMSRRLRPVQRSAIGLIMLAAVLGIPTFGWAPPAALFVAAAVFVVLQARLDRFRKPEHALAASWLLAQLAIAVVIVVASGPREFLFPLFAFPMMMASVVWPTRVVAGGAVLSALLLVGVAFATEAALIAELPPILTQAIALLVSTALVASAARDAEVASRSTAVVDQLTGALNRAALEARARELEHAARATGGATVALILGDIDRFKVVNDEHGHATGDVVLRDVAYRLRKLLPTFAGIYRFGGEEFVVLLTDTDATQAAMIAEAMRATVGEEPVEGLAVTMSFGVAAAGAGEPFSFDGLLARADAALYEAKESGRDRVVLAEGVSAATPLRAAPAVDRRRPEPAAEDLAAPAPVALVLPAGHDDRSRIADATQRQHLVELAGRLHHANPVPFLLAFAATIFLGPWYGWWPVLPVVVGAIVYRAAERRVGRLRRPEYWLAAGWAFAQTANASAYLLADIPPGKSGMLWALPILILMVVGSSAVFPTRVAIAGVLYTGLLMLGVLVAVEPTTVTDRPSSMVFLFALLAAIGLIGSAVGESAVHHRGAAIVDGLTGLLNRRALEARSAELEHQAAATGAPVAVVVGDVDHFKRVNDEHGHATGDVVLRAVAERLRGRLRAFEDVYRAGGEEFVVLLAGATPQEAAEVAERLREAVAAEDAAGVPVTMSFGVAATAPGETLRIDEVRARADVALYAAKAAGRDRVEVDASAAPAPAALAA